MNRQLQALVSLTGLIALSLLLGPFQLFAAAQEVTEPPFFTGQVALGQSTIEPALDFNTGGTVFLLTPDKSPFPSKANPAAQDAMYLPMYPTNSTIPPDELDCQPSNCDHLNVVPFTPPGYTAASSDVCAKWNGGAPCALYEGHDHIVGAASTGGGFNVAWHVKLVIFTPQGFVDGAINTRITKWTQLAQLMTNGDVTVVPTPIVFNCQIVSPTTYKQGTPLTFVFP